MKPKVCTLTIVALSAICISLAVTCYCTKARFNAVGYYIVDFILPEKIENQISLQVLDKGDHCIESWMNGIKLDLIADRRKKPKVRIRLSDKEVATIKLAQGRSTIDVSELISSH